MAQTSTRSPQANNKKPDEVYMIDVGANIGAHTMFVAAFGFNVMAFEPLRINALAIRHTLCANPEMINRVTLINKVWQPLVNAGLGSERQQLPTPVAWCLAGPRQDESKMHYLFYC